MALIPRFAVIFVLLNPAEGFSQGDDGRTTPAGSRVSPLQFQRGDLDVPAGGHVQGVQLRYDAEHHRYLAFLSHDSVRQAYVVVVAFDESLTDALADEGHVLHVHRFPEGRLRHAGGIQLHGNILAVGLEDNRSRDRSEVQFWDTTNPAAWKPLAHLTIFRRGEPKDQTAGAVALTVAGESHLVAVANWDSEAIDFYRSDSKALNDPACRFRHMSRWTRQEAETSGWLPDSSFGRCQAINLFSDGDSGITLYGLHQDSGGRDVADRFRVNPDSSPNGILMKTASTICVFPADCHFKYGGGMSMQNGRPWILATPRALHNPALISVVK